MLRVIPAKMNICDRIWEKSPLTHKDKYLGIHKFNYSMNCISRLHGVAYMQFSTIVQLSTSVYELFNEYLIENPTILDSFSSILQVFTQEWLVEVVGSHGSGGKETRENVSPPNGL